MGGYTKGTKAWYNFLRGRLMIISSKLQSPDINRAERTALYNEQNRIILELDSVNV